MLLNRHLPKLAAALAALAVFAAVLALDRIEVQRITQDERSQVLERLSTLRAKLEQSVNVAVAATRSLEILYALKPDLSFAEFEEMATRVMQPNPPIRNITLSRGTVVAYVHPLAGNEAALGLDYRSQPTQWTAYRKMMESGNIVVAGPVKLVQGGVGVIVRLPVFRESQQGREFLGSISSPLMFDRLLEDAGLHDLETGLRIAIRGTDGRGSEGDIFYGNPDVYDAQPVTLPVTLPTGSWQLAAHPRAGWGSGISLLNPMRILGGLLCLLAGILAYTLARHLQRRAENERRLNESEAQLRLQSTEMAHRNTVLEMIAQHAALPDILEELARMIEEHHPDVLCSILLLDADGKHLNFAAAPSLPDFYNSALDGITIGEGMGACGTAAWRGERVVVENIQTSPCWDGLHELAHRAELGACWSQPVKGYDGRILGTFALYRRHPAMPDDAEILLLESYAALATLAIECAHGNEALHLRNAALHFVANAMVITDISGRITWANHAFSELTGYAVSEAIGHNFNELLKSGHHDGTFYAAMWQHVLAGKVWHGELISRRKDGTLYYDEMTITPVRDPDGQITHFIALKLDISARKAAEHDLQNMAFYDPLTKLPNRRLLMDRLELSMAFSRRNKRHGALMFIDLDNFKPLNDEHGHDIGDLLLIEVAQRITQCVREEDTVARFGGDEFVVLLKELDADSADAAAHAKIVAEKIRSALARPHRLQLLQPENGDTEIEHRCTSSIGIVLFSGREHDRDDIIKCADIAMYQAKSAGRNAICLHQ